MYCSLPGSSVHGIFQAIVLEWIAISFSRGSSWPRDRTQVSCIVDWRLTVWATREVPYMTLKSQQKKKKIGISLVVQWLTTCLPMQETQVWSLVWGDSTCQGATQPVCRNYWACALIEPGNYWARVPRAHAPQQEKSLQREAHVPHREVPTHCN